jgi:hypothetical protein
LENCHHVGEEEKNTIKRLARRRLTKIKSHKNKTRRGQERDCYYPQRSQKRLKIFTLEEEVEAK